MTDNNNIIEENANKYYCIGNAIGYGGFGAVLSAIDDEKNRVAIKHMYITEEEKKERYVELYIHPQLTHPNILKLHKIYNQKEGYWLILDEMKVDLKVFLKNNKNNNNKPIRKWMYQLVSAVKYCHKQGVIHRDIKPDNILLDEKENIYLADFGSAKQCPPGSCIKVMPKEEHNTTFHCSSPELLSICPSYDNKIDVWSIGCIFFELLCGYNLFECESRLTTLYNIFFYLGTPTNNKEQIDRPYYPTICDTQSVNNLSYEIFKRREESFIKRIQNSVVRDLLLKMLILNPEDRISLDQVLQHEYFTRDTK